MTICFILRLIFLLREWRKLWVYCITGMHANCITALTKWVFYFPIYSNLIRSSWVWGGTMWEKRRDMDKGDTRDFPSKEPRGDSPVLNLPEDRCWKGLQTLRINPPPLPPIQVILFFFGIIQSPLHTNPDMFNWNHDNCFTQTWSGLKLKLENS